jgi:hypothetical protein
MLLAERLLPGYSVGVPLLIALIVLAAAAWLFAPMRKRKP